MRSLLVIAITVSPVVSVNAGVIDITRTTTATPIVLNQPGATYRLRNDLTAAGTAFVVAAKGVTLDLNGFTVTYGAAASPTVPNGGFEEASAEDAAKPVGWDVTGAPTGRRVPTRPGMWGGWMLRVENFTTPQTVTSDWVAIPEANREYAASVFPRGTSNVKVEVRVVTESGQVLTAATATTADVGRGFAPVALFAPPAGVARVRVQIVATPEGAKPASLDLDRVELLRSRDFGVMATQSSMVPKHLASMPGYRTTAGFTVRNGAIVQGAGRAYKGNPLFCQSLPGLTVVGVRTVANGMDTDNLFGHYAADIDIHDSTFDSTVDAISKRMLGFAAIKLDGPSGGLNITGNTILNAPMCGIYVANHKGNRTPARVNNNRIRQKAIVTDGYGILVNGLDRFEIVGNEIKPVLGRGILFDGFNRYVTKNGSIRDNTVESYEKSNLEYGPDALEATALRVRNYYGQHRDLLFAGNTFTARTDADGVNQAIGMRITHDGRSGQLAGANCRFEGNTFRAVVESTEPVKKAFAGALAGVSPGTGLSFRGNTFESNFCTLAVGDKDTPFDNEDVTFLGDTFRRIQGGPVRGDFQTTVIGEYNYKALDIRRIDGRFDAGASDAIAYRGKGLKSVAVGTVVKLNATAGGSRVAGATVTVLDKDGREVGNGTTDAEGKASVAVLTTITRQTTPDPTKLTTDARGPFRVVVKHGAATQDRPAPLTGPTTLDFAF